MTRGWTLVAIMAAGVSCRSYRLVLQIRARQYGHVVGQLLGWTLGATTLLFTAMYDNTPRVGAAWTLGTMPPGAVILAGMFITSFGVGEDFRRCWHLELPTWWTWRREMLDAVAGGSTEQATGSSPAPVPVTPGRSAHQSIP